MANFDWFPGKGGLNPNGGLRSMEEWKAYVDGLSRHERDQLYPGMHKDLIPAYELVMAKGLGGSEGHEVSETSSQNGSQLESQAGMALGQSLTAASDGSLTLNPGLSASSGVAQGSNRSFANEPVTARQGSPWNFPFEVSDRVQFSVRFVPSKGFQGQLYNIEARYTGPGQSRSEDRKSTVFDSDASADIGPVETNTVPEFLVDRNFIFGARGHSGPFDDDRILNQARKMHRPVRLFIEPEKGTIRGALTSSPRYLKPLD